jgi:hypothetical protein
MTGNKGDDTGNLTFLDSSGEMVADSVQLLRGKPNHLGFNDREMIACHRDAGERNRYEQTNNQ